MSKYDFTTLPYCEFEDLANDLLALEFNVRIERFKEGKDGGLDGRFTRDGKTYIIQAKHYVKTGFSGLLSHLTKTELPKVQDKSYEGYYLATSVPLSPNEKDKIIKGMNGVIKSTGDIFGQDDLNALLRAYPEIERRYGRLWLPFSSAALHRFLNNGIYEASAQIIREAQDKLAMFWRTKAYDTAKSKLSQKNVVVITGVAGVGKTTLAQQLLLEYVVHDEYEPIVIFDNIDDANKVYDSSSKQIFYFDDCWGSNYIDILGHNIESKMVLFIKKITNNNNKKLILTSRTNIAEQAYSFFNKTNLYNIEDNEFVIKVESYGLKEKAMILYFFLSKHASNYNYLKVIIDNELYKNIVNHHNYNPRLLETITDINRIGDISVADYAQYIETSLNNPEYVFEHPYKNQLNDFGRAIVDLVVLSGGKINEVDLKNAYDTWIAKTKYLNSSSQPCDFLSTVKTLLKSHITREIGKDNNPQYPLYSVFNPSIADVVIHRYFTPTMVKEFSSYASSYTCGKGLDYIFSLQQHNRDLAKEILIKTLKEICKNIEDYNPQIYSKLAKSSRILNDKEFKSIFTNSICSNIIENSIEENVINYDIVFFYFRYSLLYKYSIDKIIDKTILFIDKFYDEYVLYEVTKHIQLEENIDKFKMHKKYDLLKIQYHKSLLYLWEESLLEEFLHDNINEYITYTPQYIYDSYNRYLYNEDETVFNEDAIITAIQKDTEKNLVGLSIEDIQSLLDKVSLDDYISTSVDDNYEGHAVSHEYFNWDIFPNLLNEKN